MSLTGHFFIFLFNFFLNFNPCQHGNNEGSYCFALWLGHSSRSGHLGHHMLLIIISVAINVRPLRLKLCLTHRNCIPRKSLLLL